MIKVGQLFSGTTRNVSIEKIKFSFSSRILLILQRSKALDAIRHSNPKCLSSIAITKSNYLTEFNSSHYVTKLNKSTDAKNNSSIILVDKTRQLYSKVEDEKLLEHVNKHGKSSSSLKAISNDIGRSFSSIKNRIRKLESANEFDTNYEARAWQFEEDEKIVNYVFKLKSIKSANISSLKDTIPKDFEKIAIKCK